MKKLISLSIFSLLLILACNKKDNLADAYGNFESTQHLVTAEIPGKLIQLKVEEGQNLSKGEIIGLVDTIQLDLKATQLEANILAIKGKLQNVGPQVKLLEKQIEVLNREKIRVSNLLKAEAATQKQLDDIVGKIDILKQQIVTTKDQSQIANRAILSQIPPIEKQIEQIRDQIRRCYVKNPVDGTVLMKLTEQDQMVGPSRAIYKIADLSTLSLRAYISGEQLPSVSIGQSVDIEIDKDAETNERLKGKISWISMHAEFTPKTVQTKEERVNLVYAFKVSVDNPDGKLKIGMPGEVYFETASEEE